MEVAQHMFNDQHKKEDMEIVNMYSPSMPFPKVLNLSQLIMIGNKQNLSTMMHRKNITTGKEYK